MFLYFHGRTFLSHRDLHSDAFKSMKMRLAKRADAQKYKFLENE